MSCEDCIECTCSHCNSLVCFYKRNNNSKGVCKCNPCHGIQDSTCLGRKNVCVSKIDADVSDDKKLTVTTDGEGGSKGRRRVLLPSVQNITEEELEKKRNFTKLARARDSILVNQIKNLTKEQSSACKVLYLRLDDQKEVKKPVNDYNDTLSSCSCGNSVKSSISKKKVETLDLFARLREIYDICSCKICKCVPKATNTLNDKNRNKFSTKESQVDSVKRKPDKGRGSYVPDNNNIDKPVIIIYQTDQNDEVMNINEAKTKTVESECIRKGYCSQEYEPKEEIGGRVYCFQTDLNVLIKNGEDKEKEEEDREVKDKEEEEKGEEEKDGENEEEEEIDCACDKDNDSVPPETDE